MKLIEFHLHIDGQSIYVNPDSVERVGWLNAEGICGPVTFIKFVSGGDIEVQETYAEVVRKLTGGNPA